MPTKNISFFCCFPFFFLNIGTLLTTNYGHMMARSPNQIPSQNRKCFKMYEYHSFLQKTWRSNVKSRTKSVTKFEQILSLKNTLKCLPTYYGDLPNRPELGYLKKLSSAVRSPCCSPLLPSHLQFRVCFCKKNIPKKTFLIRFDPVE